MKESNMSIKSKIFSRLTSLEMIASPPSGLSEILSVVFDNDLPAENKPGSRANDPSLTTRMLRVADMSASAWTDKEDNRYQPEAASNPGGAKLLILSIAIYNQLFGPSLLDGRQSASQWHHFLKVANAAQDIASRIDSSSIEKAHICALLHDIGCILLEQYFPEEASRVNCLVADGMPILEAEQKIYETDHQEVGFWIATKWNMPRSLTEVMNNHHPTDEKMISDLPLVARITILARELVSLNNGSPDNLKEKSSALNILEKCCGSLGIKLGEIKGIYGALPGHLLQQTGGVDLDWDEAQRSFLQTDNKLFVMYLELANMFKERRELSRQLLQEGRIEGALDSLKIALATLSHYVNNAMMSIDGQGDILQQLYDTGDEKQVFARIPAMTHAIKNATRKISIVLEELSNITSLEKIEYFRHSRAIDIEKSLKDRLG